MQTLRLLVYAAAEIGGYQFIEMIFNSSTGRVVYDLYKHSSPLPEAIAREHGHEETAVFLEKITKRYTVVLIFGQKSGIKYDFKSFVTDRNRAPTLNSITKTSHIRNTGLRTFRLKKKMAK